MAGGVTVNQKKPIDISEAGTVERAIQIEDRMNEILNEIERYEYYLSFAQRTGNDTKDIEIHIDELDSELSDLQREYRG